MSDDEALFRQMVGDVKPLKKVDKVSLKKVTTNDLSKERARASATMKLDPDESLIPPSMSDENIDMVKPHDILSFKRSGIQDGVFRNLRLGKYDIEGRLDLHRKTVKEARREVSEFIQSGLERETRTLLITHGKGDRNIERQAILKSYVNKWLRELDDVMAFHSAQPHHGGAGSLYVLLRKSDKAKQRTREMLGR